MKYTQEVTINAPLARVAELFNNPGNMKYWRPEPLGTEHLRGTPGQPGAQTKLHYQKFDLIETILERYSPAGFRATGEVHHLTSVAKFTFTSLGAGKTIYKMEIEYTFKNFGAKLMGLLMPGMFRKQTYTYMQKFKEFVEQS